jgi:hypothetical protein
MDGAAAASKQQASSKQAASKQYVLLSVSLYIAPDWIELELYGATME